jgi:peptidoglycan hydrolase-like protein with peptidoglycan-binding domain
MAKSLDVLIAQINALSPNRSKASDGGIGNAEHSARTSDHNPDTDGVVKARDFTHDPAHGVDSEKLANVLLASKDSRIKYVISNRKIASGTGQGHSAWVWRPYSGSNPHNHHVHVSVKPDREHYDSDHPWDLLGLVVTEDHEMAPVIPPKRPALRRGDKGEAVKALQSKLGVTVDGDFGPKTDAAVRAFQSSHSLAVDGIVGPYTWGVLFPDA